MYAKKGAEPIKLSSWYACIFEGHNHDPDNSAVARLVHLCAPDYTDPVYWGPKVKAYDPGSLEGMMQMVQGGGPKSYVVAIGRQYCLPCGVQALRQAAATTSTPAPAPAAAGGGAGGGGKAAAPARSPSPASKAKSAPEAGPSFSSSGSRGAGGGKANTAATPAAPPTAAGGSGRRSSGVGGGQVSGAAAESKATKKQKTKE